MTSKQLIEKYLSFFEKKGHKIIPSAPLIPENDPTTLFISAGMHPLVPYLLGQPHPLGKRLASVQKCLRTDDIDEVGDTTHHTFFEMLGNWSLGDYFKKETIEWSYEFFTSNEWLNLTKEKLAISVFKGDKDAPFDQESYDIWMSLGIPKERIAKLPKKNNWWGPAGLTGPCGPDTEMFYWSGKEEAPKNFDPEDSRWIEIWNDVFMEYNKTSDGKFELLKQKNVDTGMGLERTLAVLNGFDDDYQTDLFRLAMQKLEGMFRIVDLDSYKPDEYLFTLPPKVYEQDEQKKIQKQIVRSKRIIVDHIRAAVFLISDNVTTSNKGHGYVLRRLIRRVILHARELLINGNFTSKIAEAFVDTYRERYPQLENNRNLIIENLNLEETKFRTTLERGLIEFEKYVTAGEVGKPETQKKMLSPRDIFRLYETFGFPYELSKEEGEKRGIEIPSREEFDIELKTHQNQSRTASAGMFKGGLADQSEITTKYHTATHLLHTALRQILGIHVKQEGSNITAERMRFDFSHPEKLTDEQLKKVEDLVNAKIEENLPVTSQEMNKEDALKLGALGFFIEKYADKVTVYSIGDFSKEICGGPHANFTGELKSFKIIKEENLGANTRRIYAKVG